MLITTRPGFLLKRLLLAFELAGAALFWRALRRGALAALQAVSWSVLVWTAFVFMTEFFVAYTSESPFRALLMLSIATALTIALIPDEVER